MFVAEVMFKDRKGHVEIRYFKLLSKNRPAALLEAMDVIGMLQEMGLNVKFERVIDSLTYFKENGKNLDKNEI
ncbi:MAG: hypothetical protein KGN01_08345 [Patescibacteria group bacterium]|nr:hypothetical protein [Patescibacteria group bacterium]